MSTRAHFGAIDVGCVPHGGSLQAGAEARARRRRQIKSRLATVEAWLPWGLMVVDKDGQIIFASRRARALLNDGSALSAVSGALRVERACVDRRLRELIRLAAGCDIPAVQDSMPQDSLPQGSMLNVIGIPDRNGRTRYAIRMLPFLCKEEELVLIAIVDLMVRLQIKASAAATIFQLSGREAEFAELFSAGLRINEIADQMHVAINTARVHLRNVFQKTGCCNQIELARTFALLP